MYITDNEKSTHLIATKSKPLGMKKRFHGSWESNNAVLEIWRSRKGSVWGVISNSEKFPAVV